MIFDYCVVKTKSFDVDFERLYDYVAEKVQEDNRDAHIYDVYLEFIDNVEYYIQNIYNSDFEEENNEHCAEEIVSCFEQYLEEKYGEDWDEI